MTMQREIFKGYIEAMFFTEDELLNDVDEYKLSPEFVTKVQKLVDNFVTQADDLIPQALEKNEDYNLQRVGNDLWFTTQGHGVGFWDRDLEDVGDKLTEICEKIGKHDVCIGDDNLIYSM